MEQLSDGRYVLNTPDGRNYAVNQNGLIGAYSHGGVRAAVDANGRLQAVRTDNLLVRRELSGERKVESRDSQGTYIVSTSAQEGFVERPVSYGTLTLVQRTTVNHDVVTLSYYRPFPYRGATLELYVPDTVFAPAYYSWLQTPWSQPVLYHWAWAGAPWTIAYQPYFQPEATYSSPSMWITDQVISSNLSSAYAARTDVASDGPPPPSTFEDLPRTSAPATTPITHEVKSGVAQQFDDMLAQDAQAGPVQATASQSSSAQERPAALDPKIQYFFVDDMLDVRTIRENSHCALSRGDVLHKSSGLSEDAQEPELLVSSSLKGDCPAGSHILVSVRDLQAMNNHCHESLHAVVERGGAGASGLPSAPPTGTKPAIPALAADNSAVQGKSADQAIAQQQAQSVKLEADTRQDLEAGLQ